MAQRGPRGIVIPSKEELLTAARGRVNLPPGELWLDYQDDVDTLYIRLKEKTHPTHSESDVDDLVVFDYEGEELVGIEFMDVTSQLKYAPYSEVPVLFCRGFQGALIEQNGLYFLHIRRSQGISARDMGFTRKV